MGDVRLVPGDVSLGFCCLRLVGLYLSVFDGKMGKVHHDLR